MRHLETAKALAHREPLGAVEPVSVARTLLVVDMHRIAQAKTALMSISLDTTAMVEHQGWSAMM